MTQVPVLQLGHGQQGSRNTQKFKELDQEGYDIELVAVADTNPEALDTVPEYFTERDTYNRFHGEGRDLIEWYAQEHPNSPPVVFDSTDTVIEGIDQHADHASAFLELFGDEGVYATEDRPNYIPSYGTEKPFTTNLPLSNSLVDQFNRMGGEIIENAVESFMPVKTIPIEDMVENGYVPTSAQYIRAGATQEKSIGRDGDKFLLTKFGGAWYDKMPHDVTKAIQTTIDTYGDDFDVQVNSAVFDPLQIIDLDGRTIGINQEGEYVDLRSDIDEGDLNEGYAEAEVMFNSVGSDDLSFNIHFIGSQTGIKDEHLDMVDEWVDQEVRELVAETARDNGFLVDGEEPPKSHHYGGAYGIPNWSQETRTERLVAENGEGEEIEYIVQTFGPYDPEKGRPSHWAVKKMPNGDTEVLYEGWEDGHKNFVQNVIDTYLGNVEEPVLSNNLLSIESSVMSSVDRVAGKGNPDTLNLTQRPEQVPEDEFQDFKSFVQEDITESI